MSNKATMRQHGRKVRNAFDKYVRTLNDAHAAGVLINADRVVVETLEDGSTNEVPVPDPGLATIASGKNLEGVRFNFTFIERMTEAEAQGEDA